MTANSSPPPATPGPTPKAAANGEDEFQQLVRKGKEAANIPVQFYGLVLDQASNALQDVPVQVAIVEQIVDSSPHDSTKRTQLQRRTGADGRFEITGLNGWIVNVLRIEKEGYEAECGQHAYGGYGAQSGSITDPVLFRMWTTNLHEPLITGNRSFIVIPDGRHYAVDLLEGTMAEGENGDLVAWIKRPEAARWGQRYDWSCELEVPSGGLLESQDPTMFLAPGVGYTNVFARSEKANASAWSDGFESKRFYIRLQRGQMYGRISIDLYADYGGKEPAMIRLSYAVNTSGSRLLR
jgi:hypothetical protein